jgi:hypothetical protein
MIEIKSTKEAALNQGLKIVVYGASGAGKTYLCSTVPDKARCLIVSAEAGLLTLQGFDMKYTEIKSIEDLQNVYIYVSENKDQFDWLCIDSLSEIAEVVLSKAMDENKNGMKAYGDMADRMFRTIRAFRDLKGVNVLFTAKAEKMPVDGRLMWAPSLPGKRLSQNLSYFFDEVLALQSSRNEEGEIVRSLQTVNDGIYEAKDRSGKLNEFEQPNIAEIQKKILG